MIHYIIGFCKTLRKKYNKLTGTGTIQEVFQGVLENYWIFQRKMAKKKKNSKVVYMDKRNRENKKRTACFEIVD